jgi:hypothetical protein
LLLLDFDEEDEDEDEDDSLPEPSLPPALDLAIRNLDTNELTSSRLISLNFFNLNDACLAGDPSIVSSSISVSLFALIGVCDLFFLEDLAFMRASLLSSSSLSKSISLIELAKGNLLAGEPKEVPLSLRGLEVGEPSDEPPNDLGENDFPKRLLPFVKARLAILI